MSEIFLESPCFFAPMLFFHFFHELVGVGCLPLATRWPSESVCEAEVYTNAVWVTRAMGLVTFLRLSVGFRAEGLSYRLSFCLSFFSSLNNISLLYYRPYRSELCVLFVTRSPGHISPGWNPYVSCGCNSHLKAYSLLSSSLLVGRINFLVAVWLKVTEVLLCCVVLCYVLFAN